MKIVQVISHYVPAWSCGGPLQVAHQLGRSFRLMGHDVTVCTTDIQDSQDRLDVPLDRPVNVDGLSVFYNPVPCLRRWGFSPRLGRRAEQECQSADLIITHFHYQYASVVGGRLARRYGKPYVMMAHGSLRRSGLKGRTSWLKNWYLRIIEGANLREANVVVYHSQEEMEDSLQFDNASWVPNGIDPEEFSAELLQSRSTASENPFTVAYLGRISNGKGLDFLIEAFHGLLGHRKAELLLIGSDERGYEAGLREQIERLGIQEHVKFTGRLAGAEKFAALGSADVYALPSRSEGMSIAMLEAMYLGLPVLVSDRVGLWREVESERCGIICRYDRQSVVDSLLSMAQIPPAELAAMGRRGLSLVGRKYTWSRIAEDLLERLGQ